MPAPAIDAPAFSSEISGGGELRSRRDVWPAVRRGLRGRCPACGEGKVFRAYLKVNGKCPKCGEELHHHRADDAPPYMTIFVVGHIVGSLLLVADKFWPSAPLWLHGMIWPTLSLILCLWLLPIMKGGLIAYQWALRMHGFENAGQPGNIISLSNGK